MLEVKYDFEFKNFFKDQKTVYEVDDYENGFNKTM